MLVAICRVLYFLYFYPKNLILQNAQFIKSQEEFNKKILERLEIQEKKQAERDKNLMTALRESKEVKKQIATAAEKKRWKWWKFWK